MLRVQLRKRRGDFVLEVDFHAPVPGITALFGRSGCGKSTLISLIAGLLSPDHGSVQIGEDVLVDTDRGYELDARHRRIGVVFQDARLFPHLSVVGNLQYGAQRLPHGQPMPIGFDDVVAMLGLGAMLQRRPHELSGGEKQRVALGRALLAQPRLLLLDEPLASLDLARRCPTSRSCAIRWRFPSCMSVTSSTKCCGSRPAWCCWIPDACWPTAIWPP
jgi:molybdate transport system ATP-binding protein